jgi:hypothetical protein
MIDFLMLLACMLTRLFRSRAIHICNAAKTSLECSDLLQRAAKFPYDANDLKWTDKGWDLADNTVMVPAGIVWERFWPRAGIAFIPPVVVLVIGSAFIWAFRGFR